MLRARPGRVTTRLRRPEGVAWATDQLDQFADAAAHATYAFAMTTSAIDGTEKSSAEKLESGLTTLTYRGPKQR